MNILFSSTAAIIKLLALHSQIRALREILEKLNRERVHSLGGKLYTNINKIYLIQCITTLKQSNARHYLHRTIIMPQA